MNQQRLYTKLVIIVSRDYHRLLNGVIHYIAINLRHQSVGFCQYCTQFFLGTKRSFICDLMRSLCDFQQSGEMASQCEIRTK